MKDYKGWLEGLAGDRPEERASILRRAMLRAVVLHGKGAALDPGRISEQLPGSGPPCPGSSMIRRLCGGMNEAVSSLGEEWPFDAGELGVWTPSFVLGLKSSGLLTGVRRGAYEIRPAGARQWIEGDLGSLPCSGRLAGPWRSGRPGRMKLRLLSFYVGEYPGDRSDPGCLAGLLAGAFVVRREEGRWLSLPSSSAGLLGEWMVPFIREVSWTGERLLVSPFWGAVMSDLMPAGSREAMRTVMSPALCPVLPAIMWRAFVGGSWCKEVICRKALPYCCGRRALAKRGISLRKLSRMAFSEWGMTTIHPAVREKMKAWARRACTECAPARTHEKEMWKLLDIS